MSTMKYTYQIEHRNAGTNMEYWTLKVFCLGQLVKVHTSKDYSYICRLSH